MFTKLILISIALIVTCNAYSLENKQSSTINDPVESIKFLITRLRDFEIPQETNKHSVTSATSGNIVKNENASPTIEKFPPLSNLIETKIENTPSHSESSFHENESKVVSSNSESVPVSSVAVDNNNVPSNTISSSDTIDKEIKFPSVDTTGERLQISFSDGKIAFSPGTINKINPASTTIERVENVENMTDTSSTTSENVTFSQTFEENQPPSLVDIKEDLPLPDPLSSDPVDDTVDPTGTGEGFDINQTPVSQETLQLIMETINSLQEQNLEVESVLNEIAIANEEAKTNTPSATELQAMVASNKQMLEKLLQLLDSLTFSEDGHSFFSPQIEMLRTNLLGLESNSNGLMSEFSKVKDVLYVVATELDILKSQSEGLNALVQEASQGYNAIENVMVELSSTRGIMEEILQGIKDVRLQRK